MASSRGAVRRHVVVEGPVALWPTEEQVALVVLEDIERKFLGWRLASGTLDVLPEFPGAFLEGRPRLCPGGRSLLVDLRAAVEDEGGARVEWGVGRVDLSTGAVARLGFESIPAAFCDFGGSPDGAVVGLSGGWEHGAKDLTATPPRRGLRHGLYLATFDGAPARKLAVFEDAGPGVLTPDDVPVQWSPDGTRIAFSLLWLNRGAPQAVTLIYDATSGAEVHCIPGALSGSASWGPDGNLLLVEVVRGGVWVHDLSADTRRQVTVLPEAGNRDMRPERALGLADDDHLVTVRQRGERVTVALKSLTTGESVELLSYSEIEARYPVIAAMPHGAWAMLAGRSS